MKKEYLLIDDDEISIMLSEILLGDFPKCENVKSFSDGPYALDYLKKEFSESTQYIILLDINMPLMNGWEFLDELSSFTSAKNFMIFMLSSSTDHSDIQKAKEFELVKSFFCKPFSEEHLRQIERQLNSEVY